MGRRPFDPSRARGATRAATAGLPAHLTVSQLTALVKQAVVTSLPATVHVIGQISNFKRHASGHLYWTLKDEQSELSCVMWRSDAARIKFQPQDGLEITATGAVDVFERAGRYQLYARRLEPRGVGALELAYRQLCERLRAEGLFAPERKRPLPRYPRRVAVVTSPSGAAVRDILQTLERRYPCATVCVCPVRVQGDGAAAEIASAVAMLNRRNDALGGIDVIIVGRGGGSIEDLWAFNEEVVARAVFASRIPVISAVGHESDVTVADLVADVRAATPTAAAELAVPVLDELLDDLAVRRGTLSRLMTHRLELGGSALEAVARRTWLRDPLESVRRQEQALDEAADRVRTRFSERLHGHARVLARAESAIQRLHPRAVLARAASRLGDGADALRWATATRTLDARRELSARSDHLLERSPMIQHQKGQATVARADERLDRLVRHRFQIVQQQLATASGKLEAMSYRATLERGFTITRLKRGRHILADPGAVSVGDRLLTETATGEIESAVVDMQQLELFD
ncbi:MAG: exodeoxyribonuclease VII large subunit [bacterium]|nr:exodeoxyribonuclease VII large subunit [bacterium]